MSVRRNFKGLIVSAIGPFLFESLGYSGPGLDFGGISAQAENAMPSSKSLLYFSFLAVLCFGLSAFARTETKAPEAKAKPAISVKTPDASALAPKPKGEVFSEAVAQAGPHVVTSREVQISHILDQALAHPAKKLNEADRKAWWIDSKSEAYSKSLAQVLLELVVQMEAENFSVGKVSQEDLQAYEKHSLDLVKGWGQWESLEVSPVEMQKILQRKMRAKNFLKFKTDSSGVQISEEDAKRFYEKNRVKFGNAPYSQYRDTIKEALAQEQLQGTLKEWFEDLKRKYRVHFLGQAG
jgi:hypothetical protein